jgi:membrane-associated protease RseP (regulator of RpoE activity)
MRMQSLWDSAMAERAAFLRKRFRRPVIILAGGGHVEYGYGIAHRLRMLDPTARIVLVMPFAGDLVPAAPVDDFWSAAACAAGTGDAMRRADAALLAPAADLFFYSPPHARPRLGMELAQEGDRLRVTSVTPGSRADVGGVRAGQYIVSLDGAIVKNLAQMRRAAVMSPEDDRPLRLAVEENGRERVLFLAPAAAKQHGRSSGI